MDRHGTELSDIGRSGHKVLGAGTVADLAKKAGIGENETTGALASLLPQVIDKISPSGKAPAANDLGGALASLGKLLG